MSCDQTLIQVQFALSLLGPLSSLVFGIMATATKTHKEIFGGARKREVLSGWGITAIVGLVVSCLITTVSLVIANDIKNCQEKDLQEREVHLRQQEEHFRDSIMRVSINLTEGLNKTLSLTSKIDSQAHVISVYSLNTIGKLESTSAKTVSEIERSSSLLARNSQATLDTLDMNLSSQSEILLRTTKVLFPILPMRVSVKVERSFAEFKGNQLKTLEELRKYSNGHILMGSVDDVLVYSPVGTQRRYNGARILELSPELRMGFFKDTSYYRAGWATYGRSFVSIRQHYMLMKAIDDPRRALDLSKVYIPLPNGATIKYFIDFDNREFTLEYSFSATTMNELSGSGVFFFPSSYQKVASFYSLIDGEICVAISKEYELQEVTFYCGTNFSQGYRLDRNNYWVKPKMETIRDDSVQFHKFVRNSDTLMPHSIGTKGDTLRVYWTKTRNIIYN